jgi:uncharacterized protein (DUF362 family)
MTSPDASHPAPSPDDPQRFSRRGFLLGALGAAGAAAGASLYLRRPDQEPLEPLALQLLADEQGQRASVFIAQHPHYDEAITERVLEGLRELGIERRHVKGRNVLLKPNLVETTPENPHINTNPTLLVATAEAFRRLDAAAVAVAEGQGHRRDSWLVLEEAGYIDLFDQAGLAYTDLNHDDLFTTSIPQGGLTRLGQLVLPKTLEWADIFVSMAKLKTHHWVGCTLSLKNLFGIMPGIYYGWPKNVLHHRGINESIIDINMTVRTHLSIVDGIIGLEGDGPINGSPKQAGVILMGRSGAAVDATGARLMNLRVDKVGASPSDLASKGYLELASLVGLGPIRARHIEQRGASLAQVQNDFAVLEDVAWLRPLKEPVAPPG